MSAAKEYVEGNNRETRGETRKSAGAGIARQERGRKEGGGKEGDGWRLTFPTGYPYLSQTPYLRIDTQFPASLAPIEGSLRLIVGAPFDFK